MPPPLICPHDHQVLVQHQDAGLSCERCGKNYAIEDGVVRLLAKKDEFYEGAYDNQVRFMPRSEKPWHIWPLWLIKNGSAWMVRRYVPQGATVVELGCGGGVDYFGRRYRMIGCDLSFSSLKKLDMYEWRIQADAAACIPLPDASVDAVISSYFWEHIPPAVKPAILKECRRVLHPGGKIIFLYDVETRNPLIHRYKARNHGLYHTLFIEGDGHLGYQWPLENIEMFRAAGFVVRAHKGMEKTWLQSPSSYVKLARFGGRMQRVFERLSGLAKPPWFYPYTALMRLVDTLVCPWLPVVWARIDLVVAQKASK